MSRVLIVNMPFANLRWPNLGPSLLKAALARRGIGCEIAYLNYDFAERLGLDHYTWIADCFAFVLGGERLFAKHHFQGLPDDESYFREVLLHADQGFSADDRRGYEQTGRHVEPFLDHCMKSIDWSSYAIVGFATSFQQTMPSMCLARRIKDSLPQIKIVFGGAACEGPMGIELLRQFPEVDYVFLGEADLTFPPVVEQILAGSTADLPPGVVGREMVLPPCPPACRELSRQADRDVFLVRKMDDLPYPDFDDYFRRRQASPLASQIEPLLFFETSRGCWWGQKHHCAFCGLNGGTLLYRSKTAKRAIDELRYLVDRHGVHRACTADNILNYRYFDSFLPMLKESVLDLRFEYEMKTNLTRAQAQLLLEAGLNAAQLGIESFMTPVLKLIGKGANAVQNLQTLKWFSEAGIEVKWNMLYGFPGEDPAGYARMAQLLPLLCHLAPPIAVGRVRMDRFAPFFNDPAAYGMVNPRANRAFRYVYPFPREVLDRLAYYYEFDFADGRNPLDYVGPVLEAIERWRNLYGTVDLRALDRPDGVLFLHDTRPCAAAFQHRLTGLERAIYLYCDTGRSLRKILEFASQQPGGATFNECSLRPLLQRWLDERLMVRLDDRYLSLALQAKGDAEPD